MPKTGGYRLEVTGYGSLCCVRRCLQTVNRLWRSLVQIVCLYTQSTAKRKYLTSQVIFVRSCPTTYTTTLTHQFLKILPVKFNFYTFYTGPMYIN